MLSQQKKIQFECSLKPLLITTSEEDSIRFLDIDTPFIFTLETCRENEKQCHIYQFSSNKYQPIHIRDEYFSAMEKRPFHQHSCIEFMYVMSGSVINHVENQIFTYEAGQCCIMNKNIRHYEELKGNFQVVFFMLRDDFIHDLLKDHLTFSNLNMLPSYSEASNVIFELIADTLSDNLKSDKIYLDCFPVVPAEDILHNLSPCMNSIVLEIINWNYGSTFFLKGIFSRLLHMLGDPTLFNINRIHSHAMRQDFLFNKIEHIMKSRHGRCSRGELEKLLHYHGEHLNRIVKEKTGLTILEYGQSIYLEEARQLLQDSDTSISTIIEKLGFSNRSHFYHLFKEKYGLTPKDYRTKYKKDTVAH